ncbi:MAG: hypothetical protein QXL40_00715 [Nitrososphaerota archaeon]
MGGGSCGAPVPADEEIGVKPTLNAGKPSKNRGHPTYLYSFWFH